ncbi:Carbohydrate-binding module family 50 protein [Mycena indigotica]|uniref:Carbohydrate-binding module family 50 protein n=1 Tax=Mycena indigotica TaxID=2126181 RepID=A0A8H6T4I6_9AGAR|nr:Carbohydrate-binding module family 50 protein [Mycena indigotica]KAF7310237.1 Carbohydrate-binding module family 50 protein [Mycena indigotica]
MHLRIVAYLLGLPFPAVLARPSTYQHFKNLEGASPSSASPLAAHQPLVAVAAPNASVQALATFQFYTSAQLPTSPAPSSSCASALTATIGCDPSVQYSVYANALSVDTICTTACKTALQSYRSAVASACAGYAWPGPNGSTHVASLAVDLILGPYNARCLKDEDISTQCPIAMAALHGDFSGFDLTEWADIPGGRDAECSSCVLQTIKTTLSDPLEYSPAQYAEFQDILGDCGTGYSRYNTTPRALVPAYTRGSSSLPGPPGPVTPPCLAPNINVVLSKTMTCDAIATQFSLSYLDIMTLNPWITPAACLQGVSQNSRLCVPKPCTTYIMGSTESCADAVQDINNFGGGLPAKITVSQLVAWNPTLDGICKLGPGRRSSANMRICMGPPGGFPALSNDGGSAVPTQSPTATIAPPGPTSDGATSSCSRWYTVQSGDFCPRLLLANAITLSDFRTLNPQVNEACTNLVTGRAYCVLPLIAPDKTPVPLFTVPGAVVTGGTLRMTPISTLAVSSGAAATTAVGG